MNRKQCKEALDIYKKFLVRMDHTAEFLKTAEVSGGALASVRLSSEDILSPFLVLNVFICLVCVQ